MRLASSIETRDCLCTITRMRRRPLASVIALVVGASLGGACVWPWRQDARESAGPAPIPASGEARADSQDMVKLGAWYERNFLEGYKRAGRHDPRWDAPAEEFIRQSTDLFLGLPQLEAADAVGRARKLLESGCDDPAVLYLAALTLASADQESREASELFDRAFAGIQPSKYSRGAARMVATSLYADLARRNEGTGRRHGLAPAELRLLLDSLRDGSYGSDDDEVLVAHLVLSDAGESLFARNRAAIVGAVERTDWVDPWARLYLSGRRRTDDAWQARGSSFANKVKPEGWKGFEESLALARKDLEASWRKRPDRPEAASRMILVSKADRQPGESPRLWFDRTVAARIDYMLAYAALIDSLRERWGGSEDELLAFARECAATRRFDTDVPFQAYEAVEQLQFDRWQEAGGDSDEPLRPYQRPPSPYATEDVYTLVDTVLERYRREPAREFEWRRFASLQAAIAYKGGKYERAREVLHELSGTLDDAGRRSVHEDTVEGRIEAYAAPNGEETRRAERLFMEGHGAEARSIFEKARAKAPAEARAFLDKRLAAIGQEAELASGRAARILPDTELHGWVVESGDWVVQPDGALLGTSGTRGLMIVADARVGSSFELETDVEMVSTTNGQFQAGILFGHRPTMDSRMWTSFRLKKTAHEGEVVYFSQHFYNPNQRVQRKVAPKSHVVIQSWDGRLWAYVDGERVIADYRPEWGMPQNADVQVGFGAYSDDNVYKVRYRGTRVRRLTAMPTAPRIGR